MTVSLDHARSSYVVLVLIFWTGVAIADSETISKTQFFELSNNETGMEDLLNYIVTSNHNKHCTEQPDVAFVPIRTRRFHLIQEKVDLVSRVIKDYGTTKAKRFVPNILKVIVLSVKEVCGSKMVLFHPNQTNPHIEDRYTASAYEVRNGPLNLTININESTSSVGRTVRHSRSTHHKTFMNYTYTTLGNWTSPYFSCKYMRWIVTYNVSLEDKTIAANNNRGNDNSVGTFSVDVDVSSLDINQCDIDFSNYSDDQNKSEEYVEIPMSEIVAFRGTHKCDRNTSKCIFTPGGGWTRGSYLCQCKDGYYSTTQNPIFNGTSVENAWKEKMTGGSVTYSLLFVCKRCPAGCDTCVDGSPCLAEYNWPFRISLLTISVICILLTILLMGYVYNYRKLKVIKVTSPIFLCITLVGAVIMYMEMAAIFPVLDMYSCIATKWTRHLGFCITYSALLLKTWRVSLTYRVKSAHKIKLTDKQLLQWLFPILLVMVIYLSTWTVSSPPHSVYISDYNGLKLKQCTYDWWDHSLAIGEILFLLWGIRVCYTVRNAESFFNEAKHISYAIYSITLVNIIMVAIHLFIFPKAPPDLKYFFGFIRTQLSTTVTILLVFGPKFYRVIKGQGDVYDNRARARGVTASFSLNGIGLVHEEPTDLFQENEELKEEIQKLAAQIEFMKIVHMEMNNRHIKPKIGGYFSQNAVNSTQSPVGKAIYMKFDSSDSPTSRISPAAELVSERV